MSSILTELSVRVHPYSAQNKLISFTDGVLHVKIAAPPRQGKANKELVAFLSQLLGISKRQFTIVQGLTNRNKIITIQGLSQKDIMERLKPYASFSGNTQNTQ